MPALIEVIVSVVLLVCIAVIVIAPTGFIESHCRFAGWFRDDSSRWGFRLSVIALSISIIALVLTLYFAWMEKDMQSKLDKVTGEIRAQRSDFEKIDSKLRQIMSVQDIHGTSLSNIESQIKMLSTAIGRSNDMKEKTSNDVKENGSRP